MSGGFGAGFIKGALLSLVVASAASLLAPLPERNPAERTQTDLSTPAASGFSAVRPDTNPVLPTGERAVEKEPVQQPRPDAGTPVSPPLADTSPAARPDAAPGGVSLPLVAPEQGRKITLGGTTGSGGAGQGAGETTPQRAAPKLAGTPGTDNAVISRPAPVPPVPSPPTTEIIAPQAPEQAASGAPAGGIIGAAAENQTRKRAGDQTGGQAGDQTGGQGSQTASDTAGASTALAALARNAVPFANPDHKPVLAIILIDAGDEGLSNDVLRSFNFPVSFALDPDKVGATAKAKILSRGNRYEIVTLAPAQLTDPDTVETPASILERAFVSLPESVALLERAAHQFDGTKGLADKIIPLLGRSGHGLITRDRNDDSAYGRARRAGIAVGSVYRVLDGARESGIVIKRYLSRAALEATRRGRIIVVGHTYPETVTAVFSWAVSEKPADVLLAPVSAVLGAR